MIYEGGCLETLDWAAMVDCSYDCRFWVVRGAIGNAGHFTHLRSESARFDFTVFWGRFFAFVD